MRLNVTPLMLSIERYVAKADNDLEEQLSAEGYVAAETAVAGISEVEEAVTIAIRNRGDEVIARLNDAVDIDGFVESIWPDLRDAGDLLVALRQIFQSKFDQLMHTFTYNWMLSEDAELAAIMDERITKPAEDFIKCWSQQLSELMHLNTNKEIEGILLTAQEQKQTIEEVSQAIADSGIREYGYKSRRVAVTEVLRVEEYAHQEERMQNPSCYKKTWVHTDQAEVPRKNHIAMDGQTVFKREPFTLRGRDGATYYPQCPRDTCLPASESVYCHCITQDVVDQEILGMSLDERMALREKYMDEVDAEYSAWQEKFNQDHGIEKPADDPSITWEMYNAYYEAYRKGEL